MKILERLDSYGLKAQGKGYVSRCPAHDDKHPSLTITEGDDGRTLIKCWSGCTAEQILDALGMQWADLFPPKLDNYGNEARQAPRNTPTIKDLEQLIRVEFYALMGAMDARNPTADKQWRRANPGKVVPILDAQSEPWEREILAAQRLVKLMGVRYGQCR